MIFGFREKKKTKKRKFAYKVSFFDFFARQKRLKKEFLKQNILFSRKILVNSLAFLIIGDCKLLVYSRETLRKKRPFSLICILSWIGVSYLDFYFGLFVFFQKTVILGLNFFSSKKKIKKGFRKKPYYFFQKDFLSRKKKGVRPSKRTKWTFAKMGLMDGLQICFLRFFFKVQNCL